MGFLSITKYYSTYDNKIIIVVAEDFDYDFSVGGGWFWIPFV